MEGPPFRRHQLSEEPGTFPDPQTGLVKKHDKQKITLPKGRPEVDSALGLDRGESAGSVVFCCFLPVCGSRLFQAMRSSFVLKGGAGVP